MDGAKVGIFATRSPHRPNPIGLSLAKLDRVEGNHLDAIPFESMTKRFLDNKLFVSGIDILDGTPVLDIKPFIDKYDNPHERAPASGETLESKREIGQAVLDLKAVSNLPVEFTERSLVELSQFHSKDHHSSADESCPHCLEFLADWREAKKAIESLLLADPRSVYRRNKCSDRLYYFTVDKVHCTCWFDTEPKSAQVVKIKPVD